MSHSSNYLNADYDNYSDTDYDSDWDLDPDDIHWRVDTVPGYETMEELYNHARHDAVTPEQYAVKETMHLRQTYSGTYNHKVTPEKYAAASVIPEAWSADKNPTPELNQLVEYPPAMSEANYLVNPQSPHICSSSIAAYMISFSSNSLTPEDARREVHRQGRRLFLYHRYYRRTNNYRVKKAHIQIENTAKLREMKLRYTGENRMNIRRGPRESRMFLKLFKEALYEIIREYEKDDGRVPIGDVEMWDSVSFRLRDKQIELGDSNYDSSRCSARQCKDFYTKSVTRNGVTSCEVWEEAQKGREVGVPSRIGAEYATLDSATYAVWKEFGFP
ncbi:hypothetical protein DSL72_001993 [Monilinia vaccinii-corymbosi]|uniref:Uncharacterized protein n=1 Tax=Monilinia vaccinii-corymbosi TaxID=61207 RepID=A0A8A3PBF2_9HELO|nr:hypothetical protein DSL72_001993 [Monilinia vaccinii-corymbosi]